jgi:hypothetical protein
MPVFDVEVGNLGSQLAIKIVNSIQLPDVGTKQG